MVNFGAHTVDATRCRHSLRSNLILQPFQDSRDTVSWQAAILRCQRKLYCWGLREQERLQAGTRALRCSVQRCGQWYQL